MEYFVISCWDYHLTIVYFHGILCNIMLGLSSHASWTIALLYRSAMGPGSLELRVEVLHCLLVLPLVPPHLALRGPRLSFGGLEFLEVAARVRTARPLPRPVAQIHALVRWTGAAAPAPPSTQRCPPPCAPALLPVCSPAPP